MKQQVAAEAAKVLAKPEVSRKVYAALGSATAVGLIVGVAATSAVFLARKKKAKQA